jgi:putative phosphoesterase
MKIAIFSDIHGNLESFNKFLEITSKINVEANIFLGDLCGYYFNTIEVIEILMKLNNLHVVRGNHDQIFINFLESKDLIEVEKYTDKYGSSFYEFKKLVKNIHFEFLNKMNFLKNIVIDEISFTLVHGGILDNLNEKIFPDSNFEFINKIKTEFFLCGHTHYGFIKKVNNVTIINPGSIGQPRDGKKPSFVILDTKSKSIELIHYDYDYKKTIESILKRKKQPEYLIEVLNRPYLKEV